MFERFTDRARRVVVLAQEESRRLDHAFIGTEHVLVALVHEGDGIAGQALQASGVTREAVLAEVRTRVPPGEGSPAGHVPFTSDAKKNLEMALREALGLGHNYIGSEHILLGMLRFDCTGTQVLHALDVDTAALRVSALELVEAASHRAAGAETVTSADTIEVTAIIEVVACAVCGRRPPVSGVLVTGPAGGHVCEHCIRIGGQLLESPSDFADDYEETGLHKLPPPDLAD
jgi:ATP-dependent Clp protease ATP-binding subunit ClpC